MTRTALALATAVGLAALSACGSDADATATDQAALTAPFARLSVTTDGAVRIEPAAPGAGSSVRRTVHYPGGPAPAGVVRTDGDTLVLDGRCGDDCNVDYVVTVPALTPVRVATTGGAVSVSDVGAADLSTDAGGIDATRVAGDVTARTDAGTVRLADVAGSADASSQAGAVSVAVTRPADVSARSDAADVTISVPPGAYRVNARDVVGVPDTAVPNEESAPHTLTAQSSAGRAHVLTG